MTEDDMLSLSRAIEAAVWPRGYVCIAFESAPGGATALDTASVHCNLDVSPDEVAGILEDLAARLRRQQPQRRMEKLQ